MKIEELMQILEDDYKENKDFFNALFKNAKSQKKVDF